jgi:hypothetical protein
VRRAVEATASPPPLSLVTALRATVAPPGVLVVAVAIAS